VSSIATELGVAYLSILGETTKLGPGITKAVGAAAKPAGKAFASGLDANLGSVVKSFGAAGKDAGEALAKSALSAAKSDVAKLTKTVTAATDKQSDALGRLRVAQAKLAEIQGNSKAKASQLAAAEEAVANAQRKATAATETAQAATDALTKAQARAKSAADDVAKAQAKASTEAGRAGSGAGGRFTAAFRSAFKPGEAAGAALNKIDAQRAGKSVATRFGVGFNGAIGGIVSKSAGIFAAGFAAIKTGGFLKDAITQASDLNETTSKVQQIFGPAAKDIVTFSKTASGALGQTQQAALDANATFGIFGKSAGLSGKQLVGFTTNLTTLAGDMASFNNTSPEQAIEAIGAALRGESEPIRAYGVLLDDATLKAEAMSLGLLKPTKNLAEIKVAQNRAMLAQIAYNKAVKQYGPDSVQALRAQTSLAAAQNTLSKKTEGTVGPLTQQQKVLAAQSAIMKQTTVQQGDFARTSGGLANQQRILSAGFTDFKTSLGAVALPLMIKFVRFLNSTALPGIKGLKDLLIKGDFTSAFAKAFHVEEDSPLIGFILNAREKILGFFTAVKAGIATFAAAWKANDGTITSSGFTGFIEKAAVAARGFATFLTGQLIPAVKDFAAKVTAGVVPIVKNLVAALTPLAEDIAARLPGALSIAKDSLSAVATIITQTVLPAGQALSKFLADNKGVVIGLAAAIGALVVVTKLHAAAMALQAAGGFLPWLGKIVTSTKLWAAATKAMAAVQWALNLALNANPIALIVIGIAALVAAFVIAYKKSDKFRNIVNKALTGVKDVAVAVFNAIKTAVSAVIGFIVDHWKAFATVLAGILLGPLGAIVVLIATHWKQVKAIFATAVAAVVGALKATWGAIVGVVSGPLNAIIGFLKAVWSRIYPIIALPVYIAIALIKGYLAAISAAFTAIKDWVVGTFSAAWNAVAGVLAGPINTAKTWIAQRWADIKAGFTAIKNWVVGVFKRAWSAVSGVLTGAVDAAKTAISARLNRIQAIFTAIKDWVLGAFARAWTALTAKLTGPINTAKNAISTALGAGKNGLQSVFTAAIAAIGRIWDGLQELAKKPIRFIVNTVLNDGLIGAFNWIAGKFQAPTIAPIPLPTGFAHGGEYTGRLPGRASRRDNMLGLTAAGPVGLATGEYIVNAADTARHKPLLDLINSGRFPGFADGGLLGKLKSAAGTVLSTGKTLGADVLGFLKDPVKWLKDRLAGPLNRLTELGTSPFAELVKAVPRSLVDTVADKVKNVISGLGGGGVFSPGLAGVLGWVRSQVGKPYLWGAAGPGGYDCSGLVGAAINVAFGRNPYSRLGSTASMPWSMFEPGPGAFMVGWFQGNPGHTAATVNGTNIESRGGRGVLMGPAARGASDPLFTNRMRVRGFAGGGLVGDGPFDELDPRGKAYKAKAVVPRAALVFDSGGQWPSGTLGLNLSGKTETVRTAEQEAALGRRRVELTITNWQTGQGYLRQIAADEIGAANEFAATTGRMTR
jgi:phage-related protein